MARARESENKLVTIGNVDSVPWIGADQAMLKGLSKALSRAAQGSGQLL